VGTVILNHHVGGLSELEEDVPPFLALEVEGHCALVAVEVLEVEAVPAATNNIAVCRAGRLDLDHLGAPVRQLTHGSGSGAVRREVEHGQLCERHVGHGHSSPCTSTGAYNPAFGCAICPGNWACASP